MPSSEIKRRIDDLIAKVFDAAFEQTQGVTATI
jgi:hypothetical protein